LFAVDLAVVVIAMRIAKRYYAHRYVIRRGPTDEPMQPFDTPSNY